MHPEPVLVIHVKKAKRITRKGAILPATYREPKYRNLVQSCKNGD